ncbi:hypothetical protein SERLADRAFT_469595 [Serpula lacrymans var. lacrymans S7.9]|uniref:Fungal-type protein kinase domain-containing protein n=1 Tax=Serpula lacrymans var. lacrymans (strain S7.9) TaxID=578457 RepID=F8NY93_SERL9|nr:uncharacterized protein SERLADRAFT_469595 [Serpula lacrymans var. lacrymans S7.9]EGO23565.1 hypothetical protein SERLADRAFT_469595 [Serpula lacrymans var. lacrymans S7.9]
MILKDSWPLDGHDEVEVFRFTQGEMGIPEVYAQYTVEHGKKGAWVEEEIRKIFLLEEIEFIYQGSKDTQSKRPNSQVEKETQSKIENQEEDVKMENRVHKRLILKTECCKFQTAAGPYQFLEGMLHGMMGHYNMYKDGWLHRDVSDGNVLLLPEPEIRKPLTRFECTKNLTKCVGVISDGDQAIRWRELDRELGKHRSGTLPYISRRVLNAWNKNQSVLHTFADDLEAFFWVILCVLLNIGDGRQSLTVDEGRWLHKLLAADDPDSSETNKRSTLQMLEESLPYNDFSPIVMVFVPFFTEIIPLMKESTATVQRLNSDNLVESLTTLGDKYYELWFKAFLRALPSLPKTWDEVLKTTI